MKFDVYLVEMLGKEQAKELLDAVHCGQTVILSGEPCTGKTTLASVLEKNGYKVVEDFETINIQLSKPLNHKIPDFGNTISLEQEISEKC